LSAEARLYRTWARQKLLDGREDAPFAPLEVAAVDHEQQDWLLAPAP
jgi:hypothetical protein